MFKYIPGPIEYTVSTSSVLAVQQNLPAYFGCHSICPVVIVHTKVLSWL